MASRTLGLVGVPIALVAWAEIVRAEPAAVPSPASEAATASPASAPPAPTARPTAADSSSTPGPGAPRSAEGPSHAAYQTRLQAEQRGAAEALSTERLRQLSSEAESLLVSGRRDEAIALLSALVESPRFEPFRRLDEGRAALFLVGDALGRAGAHDAARRWLLELVAAPTLDVWSRRAVARLVDFALESAEPGRHLREVERFASASVPEVAGDVAYLIAHVHELAGRSADARAAYLRVPPSSRFWAQATYRAGLLEVEERRFSAGEQLFCRVADPKQTPRVAPLFGGHEFFEIRDLARLALGRIAHEQQRFDDARYYYHLVPADSDHLPEALYEAATSRYEARDYDGAHRLLSELSALERAHAYQDEAWLLDAYVDLARCKFPSAALKLDEFLARYEPVRDAARKLRSDPEALKAMLDPSTDSRGARGLGVPDDVRRTLAAAIRVDPSYGALSRQLADLEHQLAGLSPTRAALVDLAQGLESGGAAGARPTGPLLDTPTERAARLFEELGSTRRLLREAGAAPGVDAQKLAALDAELAALEAEAARARPEAAPTPSASAAVGPGGLTELLAADATGLDRAASEARELASELESMRSDLVRAALERLEARLTRLVRRARAGRIETMLGKKRSLELEIEALSQGYLPEGAVDSLEAARYLRDDEEYWPFDGEDWEDEYLGGEGLR